MIKSINLIPLEIQKGWRRRQVRVVFYACAVLYVVLLGALYYINHSAVVAKRDKLVELEQRRMVLERQGREYLSLKAQLTGVTAKEQDMKRRLDLSSGLTRDRVIWSTVLKRMSNDLPGGVWLKSMTTSDIGAATKESGGGVKQVRLLGSGLTNSAVSDLIFTLENSGYFNNVQLAYTQKKELESGTVYDFEVQVRLKKGVEGIYGW